MPAKKIFKKETAIKEFIELMKENGEVAMVISVPMDTPIQALVAHLRQVADSFEGKTVDVEQVN